MQDSSFKYTSGNCQMTAGNMTGTAAGVPSKAALRALVRTHLGALTPSRKAELSKQIACRISAWDIFQKTRYVAGFAADSNEPDLSGIFDRRFVFPRWNGSAYEMAHPDWDSSAPWRKGRFGLSEPTGSVCTSIDSGDVLWLVPGTVFSPDGGRVGRGGGFYDRLLANARGIFCGVLFDCQITEAVPVEPHDCPLHCLASESSIRMTAAGEKLFNRKDPIKCML